jgi:hypothetical protein
MDVSGTIEIARGNDVKKSLNTEGWLDREVPEVSRFSCMLFLAGLQKDDRSHVQLVQGAGKNGFNPRSHGDRRIRVSKIVRSTLRGFVTAPQLFPVPKESVYRAATR